MLYTGQFVFNDSIYFLQAFASSKYFKKQYIGVN